MRKNEGWNSSSLQIWSVWSSTCVRVFLVSLWCLVCLLYLLCGLSLGLWCHGCNSWSENKPYNTWINWVGRIPLPEGCFGITGCFCLLTTLCLALDLGFRVLAVDPRAPTSVIVLSTFLLLLRLFFVTGTASDSLKGNIVACASVEAAFDSVRNNMSRKFVIWSS